MKTRKKFLTIIPIYVKIPLQIHGRLAQLVEHSLDVRVVRDSSSLSSTSRVSPTAKPRLHVGFGFFLLCPSIMPFGRHKSNRPNSDKTRMFKKREAPRQNRDYMLVSFFIYTEKTSCRLKHEVLILCFTSDRKSLRSSEGQPEPWIHSVHRTEQSHGCSDLQE